MSAEERAADIKTRLKADMTNTIVGWTAGTDALWDESMVDDLVDDAMHQVEVLLVAIEKAELAL